MKVAVIGAGWSGLSAAVEITRAGHQVSIYEASRTLGGRSRALPSNLPDGTPVMLDNGQHILIGAYRASLNLLRRVGVDPDSSLLRLPLTLKFPDQQGIQLPPWAPPWNVLAGMATARGWSWRDKASLLRQAIRWQLISFRCPAPTTVEQLCQGLSPTVMTELIAPLCLSALNTPVAVASAQVFLRVLHDALFSPRGGSDLLLPRVDLTALFPKAAAAWLGEQGARLQLGQRVEELHSVGPQWLLQGELFDAVVTATPATDAARLIRHGADSNTGTVSHAMQQWAQATEALQFEAITTVYAWAPEAQLSRPLLALRSSPTEPAQFVFDRGQLGGPAGLLAFVISASQGEREALQAQVLAQARTQLGLQMQPVQTVVEKRATFACTAPLHRPQQPIAPGLWACGDYVASPYPATIEGAVRSALEVAQAIGQGPAQTA